MKQQVLSLILIALFAGAAFGHGAFTLSITGGSPMNIGEVYIGRSDFEATPITLQCVTQGNHWELQIYATNDLTDNSTGQVLDIKQLKWFGAYAQATNPGPVQDRTDRFVEEGLNGGSVPLSLSPDTVYSDAGDQDVEVQVGLGIVVPETQPQGNYSTVVRFTMTE